MTQGTRLFVAMMAVFAIVPQLKVSPDIDPCVTVNGDCYHTPEKMSSSSRDTNKEEEGSSSPAAEAAKDKEEGAIASKDNTQDEREALVVQDQGEKQIVLPTAAATAAASEDNFTGSTVTKLSGGADLFTNVCIHPKDERNNQPQLRSYTSDSRTLYHSKYRFLMGSNQQFTMVAKGFPLEQWAIDSTTPPTTNTSQAPILIEEETVWLLTMYNNPAHAMTDQIFSFALDRHERKHGIHSDPRKPFYPRYLIGKFKGFEKPGYTTKNGASYGWLFEMMDHLGFIDLHKGALSTHLPFTCFRKLIVPTYQLHRFPLNRQEDPEAYKLFMAASEKPFQSFTSYPKEPLLDIHQRALSAFGLESEPWSHGNQKASDTILEKQILLHVRSKKESRKLTNALELKEILETQYHANVTFLKEDWRKYSLEQQAKTYNQFPYIITGHGAHLTNAIFSRPKTRIVEIFCNKKNADINPDPFLKERTNTTSYKDWWGASYASWFEHWTRRLGIDHFETGVAYPKYCGGRPDKNGEHLVPNKRGHSNDITIDFPVVLPLIVNRFGLVPRERVDLQPPPTKQIT